MMNKKGALVLRDIMFILLIFSTIIILASLFVLDMGETYSNSDMSSEYQAGDSIGNIGGSMYSDVNDSLDSMIKDTDESVGSFTLVTSIVNGIGSVLSTIIQAPLIMRDAAISLMVALKVPSSVATITSNLILGLITIVIIFVIGSAFLRGGKI